MDVDSHSSLAPGDLAVVIGGTGFIGQNLVMALQKMGVVVRVFSRRPFETFRTAVKTGLASSDWFFGDICDSKALAPACASARAVFHVSGIAHVSQKSADAERVNVLSAKVVAEVCAEAQTPRLVYVSSALAAEPNASAYARSKRQAEVILLNASDPRLSKLHVTILRPSNVYGRGMRGNIGAMIRLIEKRRLPPLPRLDNRLTLISVSDVCQAAILAAIKPHEAGQIFTLTDGEIYTPSVIESAVYRALKRDRPRWRSPRVLFFTGSVMAGALNKLGIWRNDFGLRTYKNLVADKPLAAPAIIPQLGFTPSQTLYTAMPEILGLP